MEIKTHVLTNEQHLDDTQKLTARKNIGIKVEDVKNSAGESLVDEHGVVTIPDGVAVDPELSPTSTNPVQNKVVTAALNGKVDKDPDKGLSTNDYTNDEKAKLAGIEAGAEVNVQADWEQTQSSADDFIKNKPTIPTVNDGTLSIQVGSAQAQTFTANQSGDTSVNIPLSSQNADGLMSSIDKTKLDNIESGAEKNVQANWTEENSSSDSYIQNKPTIPTVNDGTLSIQVGSAQAQTFTANQSGDTSVTIPLATQQDDGLMSSTDKTKLDGIAPGAEVNVQADWDQTDEDADDFIKHKPTIPVVNNGTLSIQVGTSAAQTFTANQAGNTSITIPLASQQDDGLMSSTDKKKLDGIEPGAEENVQADWTESDNTSDSFIQNKPTDLWHGNPTDTETGNVVTGIERGNDGVPVIHRKATVMAVPVPDTPSTILGYRGDGTSDPDPDWHVIAKSTFGASPEILDEQTGESIVDDGGEPILDETATDLWATYDGTGFGAERAVADRAGNVIDETYATKTDVANKADKVSGATSGHFASLTVSGNLADSGYDATDFVQSVVDSQTNGNIVVDGTEINVYTHPEPDPHYPQYSKKLYKVSVDSTGHVITDANSSLRPTEATDEDIANTGIFDFKYAYNTVTNKGATVAHVTNAVSTAINALDNTASSDAGNNVQVTVTQEDGVVTAVSVIDNSINANDVAGKADKVSGATAGNFAGLNASGNLTDSGSKASDFATAAQGNKADTAIQGVQKNGVDLTPDANKKVNVVVNNATLTVTVGSSSPVEFSADASQNKSVTVPLASFDKTTEPKQYGEGLMTGQEKEKLNDIEAGAKANVIEKVQKNGNELTITDKTVNVVVNDGKLNTKIGSAASATNLFSADASTDATLEIPLAYVDNTGATPEYYEGLMSASDKEKLDGIEAGAEENDVETISIGGGTPIAPTTNTTNIDIPMADFDDTGAQTTYTDGAMSGEDKEKLDNLKNFSTVTISDGAATPTTVDCEPTSEADTLTIVAGNNITLTKAQNANTVTIDANCSNTVSAGRGVSVIESPTATGKDYNVSVDGAVGYYGSMTTINNITTSPTDLLDASATPNVNSGNDRFIVALNSADNHVYLYALKTVTDALDPTNDVAGVDVFTLSFNVQVHRTQAHGFYGMAGVQLVRDSSAAIVLHSSTESYPSNVGECSVNGSTTVWNNAGTTTTITDPVTHESKDYYGYRLIYVGDTSLGVSDTIQVDARFSVVENMSGIAEYTGSITQYSGGSAIEIDSNTHEVSVRPGDGLVVDTSTNTLTVNVKADGGIKLYSDGLGVSLGLDEVTEEVVETVQEMANDMASKLTTNFPYPMITDVSYDFGSLNIGGSCICQLFSVPFRHPIVVDETYVMIYIKDVGYSQTNVMFGIYEYNPEGNNGTGQTKFICDTGAVSIGKISTDDILEFPIKHVNADTNYQAMRPDRMYYAVLAIPPNAGSGIFLASAPNYNDSVNSMPTLNWRITNCSDITWNDPTNATLDETQVNWWDSGYNEHASMNRFFMQLRNHLPQNNSNNSNIGGNGE